MSYSIQRAVSDGTLSSLALSIQFYNRTDISVYLGNVLWPVNTVWSWVGATGSTIKFKDPVPAGIEVMVKRITDVSDIRHNFSQGAQFTSGTLDDNFKQMLFVAQEAQEGGRTITDVYGDIDMHGFKVRNMGAATELSGAAQLAQAGGGSTGNTPGITYQPFTGDGVTTAFPLTSSSLSMFVFVSGVYQQSTGWGLVGPSIVFSEAPPKGVAIEVLSLGTVGGSAISTMFNPTTVVPKSNVQEAIDYLAGNTAKVGSTVRYAAAVLVFDATDVPDGACVIFSGRSVRSDPGGGAFTYYKEGTQTVDYGMIYAPLGGGRLVRNGWTVFGFNGGIRPEWYGALGNAIHDDKSALQAASDAAQAFPRGGRVELSGGRAYAVGSTWAIPKLPDKSILIKGNRAVVLNLPTFDGNMTYFGRADNNVGGSPIEIEHVDWRASTPNANGLILQWASSSTLTGCRFFGGANGVYLQNSYAVTMDKPGFFGQRTAGIQSETHAHHLTLIAPQFSDCTRGIYFQKEAYNLTVIAPDGEGGMEFMELARGGSSVSVTGGYIEGYTVMPYLFGMTVSGFSMTGAWFGYNAAQTWTNISGGIMSNNTYWDQTQTLNVSCVDLDVGPNTYIGTSNKIYSPFAAPTLTSGFSNLAGFSTAGYRKDQSGTVYLRGMVTATVDGTAFTLPVGYHPIAPMRFSVLGDTGTTIGAVTIDVNGGVTIIRAAGGRADLGSICFTAAG